jgi:hypothetical protein
MKEAWGASEMRSGNPDKVNRSYQFTRTYTQIDLSQPLTLAAVFCYAQSLATSFASAP